ncbi:MAG: PEP-utilizing enzyme, mobile region [Deltaproteobacteria bacterium]|nr:PEP-utilizing enzyme, mobile region [Deltaproteobacteria bacterium]
MSAKFLSPHEIPTIPGTEGWERMYPYHYQFSKDDPARAEHEAKQFWFYDGLHYPEPHYPFDVIMDEAWYLACSQANTRLFLVPPANGIDHRIINGYIYVSGLAVEDPEEVQRRIPLFMKRAGHYYQNWNQLYDEWKVKMNKLHEELAAVSFEPLPKMEDDRAVFEVRDVGSGYRLLTKYDELIHMATKVWQYHFEFLNIGYAAYVTFMNTANSIFPDIPSPTLTKMVSGIDVVLYRPDAELIRLAKLAIETGVDAVFAKPLDADGLMAEMAQTTSGRHWLAELETARYPWFYISTGTGWYHHHSSWNDNLNVPFDSIRMHIQAIKAGKPVGRPTEKLAEERDLVIEEYRALIDNDADRKAFDEARGLAATVFPYVEDHMFYVEHWFHSVFWNKVRQVADILKGAGFIEDREDIWYLKRSEIRDALWDYVCNWACDTKPRGPSYWPKEIAWRKGVLKKFQEWTNPPAVGTPPEVVTEPFTIALFGVTTDTVKGWLKGMEAGALGMDGELQGLPGSPGVVQGRARVIRTVDELSLLQEGEILVAPTTSPSWAPAFTKIVGAVTDVGGVMCHAAIVCREYGLPTVVGIGRGTSVIRTGDLIRLDGNEGLVRVLERAAH